MRILQINSVCGVGSTGRICTDLAKLLEENGHECKIAYGRKEVPACYEKYSVRIGNELDVKIHAMQSRLFDCSGLGSGSATRKFIKWIKEYDPDVIHIHNLHGYYINIEVLFEYLKSCEKKIIWTLHDCWAFTGHCSYFDFAECSKWQKICFECPEKKSYPKSAFLDNSRKNYLLKKALFTGIKDLTIATPSKWLAEKVEQSFLKEYPIKVINNGIDLQIFKPTYGNIAEKYNVKNKKVILGVANVWDKRKGLNDFINLVKNLDKEYKIMLVGLNRKQISELPENIIGIERTDNVEELAELYTQAYVFLNPTYEDNFPTVNIEALSCGSPVITYKTGGSPEIIDEKCGFIIDKMDINGLYNGIKQCNEINSNDCLERAQRYNKQEKFMEYIELYEGKR